MSNQLYFGDNLDVLRQYVPDQSVDLIYLDPPFNSSATYNVLFSEKSGKLSTAQITAFEDTWEWGQQSEAAYYDLAQAPSKLGDLIQALRSFLGQNNMMAYLVMMAVRLEELRRVLKPTGSIYLHCDPTASHYLKLVMDAVFGVDHYTNELVWKRTSAHGNTTRKYAAVHDILLFYTKANKATWNQLFGPYREEYIAEHFVHVDPDGRRFRRADLRNPGVRPNLRYDYVASNGRTYKPHPNGWAVSLDVMKELDRQNRLFFPAKTGGRLRKKIYFDESPGVPVTDFWDDLPPIHASAAERLGYPTQKPEALLERIILSSSNEGDVVLDPFCGCGTTIAVAENLKRKWIGIDVTYLALTLMRNRLRDTFGNDLAEYTVDGVPTCLSEAVALAEEDRHKFEQWALGVVEAQPRGETKKKGADRGIDGEIRFRDDVKGDVKRVIVQVKSGHVTSSQIRDLHGVLQREKAQIGAFVTLKKPTKKMLAEARSAGFYVPEYYPDLKVPRIQVLTIEDLLDRKISLKYPMIAPAETFRAAPRKKQPAREVQIDLPFQRRSS